MARCATMVRLKRGTRQPMQKAAGGGGAGGGPVVEVALREHPGLYHLAISQLGVPSGLADDDTRGEPAVGVRVTSS